MLALSFISFNSLPCEKAIWGSSILAVCKALVKIIMLVFFPRVSQHSNIFQYQKDTQIPFLFLFGGVVFSISLTGSLFSISRSG